MKIWTYTLILSGITFLYSCANRQTEETLIKWQHPSVKGNKQQQEPVAVNLFAKKKKLPVETEVYLKGRLVYNFDEAAIYPTKEGTEGDPVWLTVENNDLGLHEFLLENAGATVAIQGTLSEYSHLDSLLYGASIKDITLVCGKTDKE